jgi:hypothetical protein
MGDRKARLISSYARREIEILRFRRIKITVDDFQGIKTIGKGAYGEVSLKKLMEIGQIGSKKRHGNDLRHENIKKSRNV